MLDWLNEKFGLSLNEEDVKEVKDFAFLWNVFEGQIFDTSFSVAEARSEIRRRNIPADLFVDQIVYFRNRYAPDGRLNERFHSLHLRDNNMPQLIADVLTGRNTNPQDEVLTAATIVYRYKNNLYHGLTIETEDNPIISGNLDAPESR